MYPLRDAPGPTISAKTAGEFVEQHVESARPGGRPARWVVKTDQGADRRPESGREFSSPCTERLRAGAGHPRLNNEDGARDLTDYMLELGIRVRP